MQKLILVFISALMASCAGPKNQESSPTVDPFRIQTADLEGSPVSMVGRYEGRCTLVDSNGSGIQDGYLGVLVAQTDSTLRVDYTCSPTPGRQMTPEMRIGSTGDLTVQSNALIGTNIVAGQIGKNGLTLTSRRQTLETSMQIVVRDGRLKIDYVSSINGRTLQTMTGLTNLSEAEH